MEAFSNSLAFGEYSNRYSLFKNILLMTLSQINFDFEEDSKKNESRESVKRQIKPKSKRGRKSLKDYNVEPDIITVPEDEILFQKQYYSIGEVAIMFRENQSLIPPAVRAGFSWPPMISSPIPRITSSTRRRRRS